MPLPPPVRPYRRWGAFAAALGQPAFLLIATVVVYLPSLRAGFIMDDLQLTQEDNQLVIRGRQTDDSQGRVFLHRGIAARQFQRAFVLAEGIEVKGAWLDNGLLHIDLARPVPEPKVKTIPITRPANSAGSKTREVITRDIINGKMVETEPE